MQKRMEAGERLGMAKFHDDHDGHRRDDGVGAVEVRKDPVQN